MAAASRRHITRWSDKQREQCSMALPQEEHQTLPEPLHNRALQYFLNNLDRELAGQSTDDPEFIDRELLSLPLLSLARCRYRQFEGATGQTGQPVSLVPIWQAVFIFGFIAFSSDSGSIQIF
jgi:hypothetical protein